MTSEVSDNLALPYLMPAQAQKHVTHNEALRVLDAIVQLCVEDRDLASPPSAPVAGSRYIVADGASDAWAGNVGRLACWQDGAWSFFLPGEGWTAWVRDEDVFVVWTGSDWDPAGIRDTQELSLVGVNTTADTTNRLAVKSDAALFNHDDVTPGTGDMRVVYNKSAAGKTCSFLFQDNASGRGEVGLTGDDDLHFKVSPDGSSWKDALKIDKTSGLVTMPFTPHREVLTAARSYYVDNTNGNDANTGLAAGSGNAFKTIQKAIDTAAALDISIYDVTIHLADDTYSTATGNVLKAAVGSGTIIIEGNVGTPANVIVTTTGAMTTLTGIFLAAACTTKYIVKGVKLTSTASGTVYGLVADQLSVLEYANIEFGAGMTQQVRAANKGIVQCAGNCSISGSASNSHIGCVFGGLMRGKLNATPVIDIAAALSIANFVNASQGSIVGINTFSFTGSSFTGAAYSVTSNAVLQIVSLVIPGSSGGTTATGGQVV